MPPSAIAPTGFCYPGTGRGGDLPPRPECAPLWHPRLRAALPGIKMTLLVGGYAQAYYLAVDRKRNLTATVAAWTVSPSAPATRLTGAPAQPMRGDLASLTVSGTGVTDYRWMLDVSYYRV